MAVAGALLTAPALGIGGGAWGFVVLAAFVATLLAGLAVKYGLHRFAAAYMSQHLVHRRPWPADLIAFGLPGSFRSGLIRLEPWKQALAWLVGSAVGSLHLHHVAGPRARHAVAARRRDPRGYSPGPLPRPLILFAVLRAVAVSAAVAIAFGLKLPAPTGCPSPPSLR